MHVNDSRNAPDLKPFGNNLMIMIKIFWYNFFIIEDGGLEYAENNIEHVPA